MVEFYKCRGCGKSFVKLEEAEGCNSRHLKQSLKIGVVSGQRGETNTGEEVKKR